MRGKLTAVLICKEALLLYRSERQAGTSLNRRQKDIEQKYVDFPFEASRLEGTLGEFSTVFLAKAMNMLARSVPKDVTYRTIISPTEQRNSCASECFNSVHMRFCMAKPDRISVGYLYELYLDPMIGRIDIVVGPPEK